MEEDRKEEDIQTTSQVSSMQESNFVDPSSTQIDDIEDQLKKAQETLLSLQKIKQQLEQERRSKIKAAEAEREKVTSQKLKEENDKLKRELHEYQEEINSLKDIISVFKNDLLKTAEHLQSRVSSSLDRIDRQSHSSRQHVATHTHHSISSRHHSDQAEEKKLHTDSHQGGFFGQLSVQAQKKDTSELKAHGHESESIHKDENVHAGEPVAKETTGFPENQTQSLPLADGQPTVVTEEKKEVVKEAELVHQEEPKPEPGLAAPASPPIPTATQNVDASQPVQTSQVQETANMPSAPEAIAAVPAPSASQNVADTSVASAPIVSEEPKKDDGEEKILKEEMSEYDEIKRELEALENESVFGKEEEISPTPENGALQAEPDNSLANTNNVLKSLIKKIAGGDKRKTPKVPEMVKAIKAEPSPQNSAEFKEQFWQGGDNSHQNQPSNSVNPSVADNQPSPTLQSENASMANNIPNTVNVAAENAVANSSQPNVSSAPQQISQDANTSQDNILSSAPMEAPVQIKKLHTVFKKKKKAMKESRAHDSDKEDHHKPHGKGMGALGKMAVRAAVVVLILLSGLVAYKLKNADQLRGSYMSKAKENVVQAGKASNAPPAGFSDLPVEERYKEAFAEVKYEDTIWTEYNDSDLGVKLKYPQNATYRVKPIGSNNLWFLRKNGYLVKIEKIDTEQTLEEVAESVAGDINYKQESLVVKNNPTIHMILQETLPVMGNIYLVKVDDVIYKVWYKTFISGEAPDDEQRLKTLLDTLEFTHNDR